MGAQLFDLVGPVAWAATSLQGQRCECHFSGDPLVVNADLLRLAQSQLDRCGPSHLNCAPERAPPCPDAAWWPILAGFALGLLAGAVLCGAALNRASHRLSVIAGEEEGRIVVGTPLTRRR